MKKNIINYSSIIHLKIIILIYVAIVTTFGFPTCHVSKHQVTRSFTKSIHLDCNHYTYKN